MIERILKRTMRLFLFAGFAKTNTDEIAKHRGISKRTFYRYYNAKEKLINAVFNFLKEQIMAQHEAIIKDKSKGPSSAFDTVFNIFHGIENEKSNSQLKNPIVHSHPDTDAHTLFFKSWISTQCKKSHLMG
ncbi:TetR/AcrR family transcriptional regulator [Leptospira weilii]|uniref:TetR/AcrR family transcriptional regulator n=1 Tax=Leptospira weilii TaxID=28184 RepID=UPI001EF3C04D|nr:TetR/AcrR family transcriptional regulator [Leptospira weilii]ULH27067.1 TetR/AcrR family transcriptional regulator [Leptospira weilii]UPY80726.1 TetR/AcrR family transcriptional regulator [Leptospira weilii]